MISIIIPVYNEERVLPLTLAHLGGLPGRREIIAVDGGSSDRTLSLLRAQPEVHVLQAAKGRASQMNAGAAAARGEWLLFLHADTRLPDDALTQLSARERDPHLQAGGFRHRFSGRRCSLRLISWLDNQRCRLTRIVYGDQAMFIRRDLFVRLGGFPDRPVLEDVVFCQRLRRTTRPELLPDYVVTDSRKFEQMGVWRSLAQVLLILACHRAGLPLLGKQFFRDIR